jgi:transcriptional regulator with XRE-family HTH domain
MKKASTLLVGKNLKWLMGDKISPYALSSVTGVPQPTIFRILTGESDDPRTKTLQPLAAYFGVTVADLRDRDLEAFQADHIAPAALDTTQNGLTLDARQHEWLSLLAYLGSDDIAEFTALIRDRQERNARLVEELELHLNPRSRGQQVQIRHESESKDKKQRSQSS